MSECRAFFEALDAVPEDAAHSRGDRLREPEPVSEIDNESQAEREYRRKIACLERARRLKSWEGEQASIHSPGPVGDDEMLRRALRHPLDFTSQGQLVAQAFSDIRDLGLSMDRASHTDLAGSKTRALAQAESKGRTSPGYVELRAGDLRALVKKNADLKIKVKKDAGLKIEVKQDAESKTQVQTVGIFDTALADNPAHAEAFCIAHFSNRQPYSDLKHDLLRLCSAGPQEWA